MKITLRTSGLWSRIVLFVVNWRFEGAWCFFVQGRWELQASTVKAADEPALRAISQLLKLKIATLLRPYHIFAVLSFSHLIIVPSLLPLESQSILSVFKMDTSGFSKALVQGTKLQDVITLRKDFRTRITRQKPKILNSTIQFYSYLVL